MRCVELLMLLKRKYLAGALQANLKLLECRGFFSFLNL